MKKKFLALVLTLAMVLSLVPATALAGNTSLLSITPPNEGKFATYEFYISETAESPWYTQTVKTGDTLNRPADPTRTGHYFTGWKTENEQKVPFGRVTVEEASTIRCFAQWTENANPIHVYFMAAIGSNEVMHTGVAQNGAVDIPPDYQDITWKTENNEVFDRTNVTEDMKVYPASAFCWLTFDSQGGSAIASHYVQQGERFELINVGNPTKAGYRFAGWSLEANGTKQTEVTPNGDTKLYALWTPTTADYTVIHWQENANDDEYSYIASEPLSGRTGDQTNAAAKSYQGFTATEIKQQTIKGDGSTIVNVYYQRNSYTIHFYYREYGSWKEYTDIQITAKYGADISTKWPEKKNSKTWSTNEKTGVLGSLKGPFQVNIQTMPLGGAKYYGPKTDRGSESAHYYVEVIPGESGTVTRGDVTYKLHHTDTSPGSNFKVTEEDKYPLTDFTYKEGTRDGGWYNNAQFYYTRNIYNVVYFSNDGKVNESSYKYEQDIHDAGNYTPTNAPDGYEFGGWYSDPSGTRPYDFSGKTMPAQNITVYAKWVPITLKLTIQGVDGVGSDDVNYNQVINEAEVYGQATTILENAGKTVLYWVTSTGERVDVNSQMTTNLTIRPVLKGDTYSVTYSGDTTTSDPYEYWHGTTAKVKKYQGEKADKFLYWTDAAGTKYHPGDEISMIANVTLTPQISDENPVQQKYSVTYHSNFGTDQTYTVNDIENYTKFFTKTYAETGFTNQDGYDFIGWNTQADGKGTNFAAGSPARMDGPDNNHLYAQWSQSTYTLTYDANGGQFGSGDSAPITKQESDIPAGDHFLKYSPEYTPTHAQSGDKDVVFIGWSTTDNDEKIYDKGENIPTLIQSVTMNGDETVYAVWGYDAIGKNNKPDGVPDVFNAVVTYNIVGGTWDGTNNSATEVIKVKTFDETTKVWTNTNAKLSSIPNINEVKPDKNHTSSGSWGNSDSTPTKDTVVDADTMYTYTLEAAPPAPTYTLTYDANGGKFGSDDTKTETIDKTGNHALNYTSAYTPIHAQSGDKNVIFLGWSAEKLSVLDSTSNAATNANKIITSVNVTADGATVYAVWGLDEDGNQIPDVFEATIIYKIVNGKWTKDGKAIGSADITATFQLYEQQDDHTWKATNKLLRDGSFPAGYTGNEGHTGLGWYRNSETTPLPSKLVQPTTKVIDAVTDAVTGAVTGAEKVFTYKYAPTTPKTVVLHLEGGSYTTTPDTYTANSDGTYQYSVTETSAVINPQSPSRNNFGFTGWSLSKNAPQTLISKDATFASLYLKQSGMNGNFDKINLYAVWTENGGGGGGGGGSHKPTVTIPDDVPTGLNGKDHYAYVVGYPDGMVYPQKNITRAEVATIFFRLLTDETREANMTKSNSYNDMKDGAWYTCAVSTLSKMGIIKGYEDGSFKPDASISRAEFAAIAARFDPDGDKTPATFSDVSSHWAKDEISIAANHGWIKGYEDGSFKPDQKITRAETMTLVNRVLKRLPETKDDLHKDMKTWPDNQNESAWFYLAVQEATNSHYQKLKKDGTHETWESMRETRDWAALEK